MEVGSSEGYAGDSGFRRGLLVGVLVNGTGDLVLDEVFRVLSMGEGLGNTIGIFGKVIEVGADASPS